MKVVVRAGVSKNGPGAVWVEAELVVLVGVMEGATMVNWCSNPSIFSNLDLPERIDMKLARRGEIVSE